MDASSLPAWLVPALVLVGGAVLVFLALVAPLIEGDGADEGE